MDLRGDRMAAGGPMIRHLKEGSYQRNIWQEHICHLVNDEFLSIVDTARDEIKPSGYLTMTAHLAEIFDREREHCQRAPAALSRCCSSGHEGLDACPFSDGSMKFLTIRTHCLGQYGSENHMLSVAFGLLLHGIEVHAAFPRAEGTASMIADCAAARVPYRPFDCDARTVASIRCRQVRRLLEDVQARRCPDYGRMANPEPIEPALGCATREYFHARRIPARP